MSRAALVSMLVGVVVCLHGQTVREIRFDPPLPGERFRAELAQQSGKPLDAQAVRDSIARLYATGRYADLEVESTPAASGDGVVLTFRGQTNFFVGAVSVFGVKGSPTDTQVVNSTKLQLGELYTDAKRDVAVNDIANLLLANGFHHAQVIPHTTPHPDANQIDVRFEIIPGVRAKIGDLIWQGDPGFPTEKLASKAKLKRGSPATGKRIQQAVLNLRKFYQSQTLLAGQADLVRRVYDPQKEVENVEFRVIQGPKIVIQASTSGVKGKTLKSILPMYEEGAADIDLVKEGARNLRDYLQSQGYFEATVQGDLNEDLRKGVVTINYKVDRGPKHRLDRVEIAGNKFFDADTLLERMTITPKSATGRGRFSRGLLDNDVASIKELYRSNGFRQVAIDVGVDDDFRKIAGLVHVRIKVTEGPQTLVGSLRFDGNKEFSSDELRALVAMQDGQAFSEDNAGIDRDTVLAFYYDHGFPEASFAWKASPGGDNRVDMNYTIVEGKREYVERIFIAGEQRTKTHLIAHEIEMRAGEPLSQSARLETQRRLYDLGVFSRVDLAVQNPDGDETRRTMLLQMEEVGRWTLATGVGAEIARIGGGNTVSLDQPEGGASISPRFSFDATRVNIFGEGHSLAFKTLASTIEQRGSVLYTAPRILNNPKVTLYLNALASRTDDIRTFTQLRYEGSASLAYQRNRSDTIIYRLSYRRVKEYNIKIDPTIIPSASLPVRVAIPSITLIRDKRDAPADSHRGYYFLADAGVSTGWLGSESNFTHLYTQHSSYYPFGKGWVLARNTLFGVQEPYGGLRTENVVDASGQSETIHTRDIPLAEAFYSGGSNSHRGFSVNQAGPRDPVTGFPLGGNALFINSVELRVPIQRPNLGGVLFYDVGNVFDKVGDISFRFKQRNDADFNYMVHAAGIGVRYKTPIGPMRIDLAWAFNPPAYQGVNGTLSDLLNSKIPLSPVGRRLSHFQIFFSIGQTY